MTHVQRVLLASVLLAAVLSAERYASGQAGELEVTLRVLDDVTGIAAALITIPPEPSSSEAPERTAAPGAEAPPAESTDAPPAAGASQ